MGAVMTLWPALPFDAEETLLSYADRLSMLHTGRGMERIVRDFGINTEHFVSGRKDAIVSFAEAAGIPLADAERSAIRVFPRGGEFRGEASSKTFLLPQAKRYCPACLEEDGSSLDWRFRLIWGFRHVQRCDRHGVWLQATGTTKATDMRRALNDTPMAAPSITVDDTPTYLDWLRSRVHGHAVDETWLAEQTTEQVLAASEMIGAVLQHGHKVALKSLSMAEAEEATDIGFSIYSEGPKAVEEALGTIRCTSPATAVQAGPLAHYGKLFDWLDRRSNSVDPGPIRDILRDHIVQHSAVEPGTTVLGVEINERRFHTLCSLSAAVGIDRPRLSRLLKKLGEIPTDVTEVETGNMLFEVDKTIALIDAFDTAIALHDVPEYLGASKRQVEILYRVGMITPLVPRTGRGAVRNVVFARDHLDGLMSQIEGLPILEPKNMDSFYPIAYACQRGAGRFEDLFLSILDGKIAGFRRRGKTGIAAIMVDVADAIQVREAA